MPLVLTLVGICGIFIAGLMLALGGGTIAIVLPTALVLLSFMLIGVGEMLRVLWMLEKRARREADGKAALTQKIMRLERAA
jgi:hypothetical protein